jgi:hypothetical protein
MLVPLYQFTCHSVPDTCTLDIHNDEKLNFIYVNTVIYKECFRQMNLHDMCLSMVKNANSSSQMFMINKAQCS